MNSRTVGVVAAFLTTGVVSFYGGYLFAESKLNKLYNDQMEAEIARTRAFYDRMNKRGDFESPLSAAEALGVNEAADALLKYGGETIPGDHVVIEKDGVRVIEEVELYEVSLDLEANPNPHVGFSVKKDRIEDVEVAAENHNVFDDSEEEENRLRSDRDPAKPYMITKMEFMENEGDFDQVSVVFYEGDKVLADDDEKPMSDVAKNVGLENLTKFGHGKDPNTVFVRNERTRIDYEISRNDGKYMHVVAGLQHSDETFERTGRRRVQDN